MSRPKMTRSRNCVEGQPRVPRRSPSAIQRLFASLHRPRQVMVRTIDTGGAGPVSGLLEARRMVLSEGCDAVAVVAGDAVSSLDTADFLARADQGFNRQSNLPSPCIPHGYNRVAECVWPTQSAGCYECFVVWFFHVRRSVSVFACVTAWRVLSVLLATSAIPLYSAAVRRPPPGPHPSNNSGCTAALSCPLLIECRALPSVKQRADGR
jgi:hypothetical protein